MNQKMGRKLNGKIVVSVKESSCTVKQIIFTDGTVLEMEVVLVDGSLGLYGVETHIYKPTTMYQNLK